LQVAKLAGVPRAVLAEAKARLATLEATQQSKPAPAEAPQLGLFAPEHPVLAELKELDVDALTPKQALDLLYELRKSVGKS